MDFEWEKSFDKINEMIIQTRMISDSNFVFMDSVGFEIIKQVNFMISWMLISHKNRNESNSSKKTNEVE